MNSTYLQQTPEYVTHVSVDTVPFPTAINIELTTRCNLRCIMCPKTSGLARTPPDRVMASGILDTIIESVLPHVFRIDLVGDGEILLVPALLERVLAAAQRHHVLVNASTNGVLLTDTLAEMLVSMQLTDLNISLDACTSDTFRTVRGADLDTILSNIDRINRFKDMQGSTFPRIQFSMVGMKRNIHELPGLVDLASRYRAESVMLQAMGEFAPVQDESVYLRDKALGRQWLESAHTVAKQKKIQLHLWPEGQFDDSEDTNRQHTSETQGAIPRLKDCAFPWDVPYFAADGTVRPCCAMPPMGDLKTQTFPEIWHGKPYSELRKAINSPTPPHECIICPGRGWFRPEPCANRLIPGIHDRQFGTGWFETEEYQGEFYRWAREKSVFFIRGAGPGVLQVEIHTVWDEGTTQTISIQVDNEPARTVHFSFGERRKTVLPVYNTKTLHAVTLRGDVWRPVTTVPGQQDPRALSVMFYGARLDPMPEIVEFEHGIRLIGWEIQSGDDATVRVKLFWDIPPDLKGNFGVFIHGFPAPVAIRPIELLAHELRRRRKSMASRFQADDVMVRSQHTGELARQTCILQKPGNSHGSYLLYLGIRDHTTGRRVRVVHTGRPVYRSAIELGMIRA